MIRLTTITLRHFDAGERAPSTTPKAAVSNHSTTDNLFDQLVGAGKQGRRDFEAERLAALKLMASL